MGKTGHVNNRVPQGKRVHPKNKNRKTRSERSNFKKFSREKMGMFFYIHLLHTASSALRKITLQLKNKLKFVTKKALSEL